MSLRSYLILTATIGTTLTGCVLGPNFTKPASPITASSYSTDTITATDSQPNKETPADEWWKMFNDPVLNDIIARVATESLDVQIAGARIAQSRAQQKVTGSLRYPQINGDASFLTARSNPNGPHIPPITSKTSAFESYRFGVDVAWELDVFGRIKRSNEAATARADAAQETQRYALLSVESEIATLYIQLRGVQSLRDILNDSLSVALNSVSLTRTRFLNGVTTKLDVANAEAQVALIESQLPEILAQENAILNSINVLLGQPLQSMNSILMPKSEIPLPPNELPVGIPSDLVRRRPDIRGAEANLHAATASIGMAEADFYPKISLGSGLGSEAIQLSKLGTWASRQFFLGPAMSLPIFNGGRLTGMLELRKAEEQESAIRYKQTVLEAWGEVDTALANLMGEQKRCKSLLEVVRQNETALVIAQRRYKEGVIDFLNVLSVQKSLLAAREEFTNSRVLVGQGMVTLYKALGGGWETALPQEIAKGKD
jgi:NodT family efflux transporter outer membrane factor (OMF) lipoprotein